MNKNKIKLSILLQQILYCFVLYLCYFSIQNYINIYMSLKSSPIVLLSLAMYFLIEPARSLSLQIPSRPTQFPLVLDTYSNSGNLIAWGANEYNQSSQASWITNAIEATGGPGTSYALLNNGNVLAWGNNNNNYSTAIPDSLGGNIQQSPFPSGNAVQIAAGGNFGLALVNNGSVIGWGGNPYLHVPTSLNNVVQICAGWGGLYALLNSGTVVFSGGSTNVSQINGLSNVVSIAGSRGGFIALLSNGSVQDCNANPPTLIKGLTNVVQVAQGDYAYALKSDGTVVSWGNSHQPTNAPSNITNIVQIAAGISDSGSSGFAMALRSDGTVVTWGDNQELYGYGLSNIPAGLTNVISIGSGYNQFLAIYKQLDQHINQWGIIPNQYYNTPFSLFPPTASSGLPVKISVLSGPATIQGNFFTPTGIGTVTISAYQPGNQYWNPSPIVSTSFVINPSTQTIFPPITNSQTFGTGSIPLNGTDSSGLPLTYQLLSGPATLANNTLTPTGVGTVTYVTKQAGNSNFLAASVTNSFAVQYTQKITPFTIIPSKTFGNAPFVISRPIASSGLIVSLSVLSGPATINGSTVTLTGAGTVVLAANQSGNSSYAPAPLVTTSFIVNKANQTISLANVPHPTVTGTYTIPTLNSSAGLPVTFGVSSQSILINAVGTNQYNIPAAGTVIITANQPGNANYNAAPQASISFTVTKAPQTITFPAVGPRDFADPTFSIAPSASSGLQVATKVLSGPATVSGNNVTLTGTGTVVLAANQAGNSAYLAAPQVTMTFTVKNFSQSIGDFAPISNVTYATTKSITITPPVATSGIAVTVSVQSGPATISGNKVSLTGKGTVVLVAKQAGNANYNAATPVTTSFSVN